MLGALCHYITHAEPSDFQPMKANFGILPELPAGKYTKRERNEMLAKRSIKSLQDKINQDNSAGIL
jgi:methylenetetrahydrofolate--tRNA-(uracil-5-)-methyltransferase